MNNGKKLYRDPKQGKIAGVCVGIAEFFGIEIWLVRILTVAAFLLMTGPFIFLGYIVLWAVLDKKSNVQQSEVYTTKSYKPGGSNSATFESKGYVNRATDAKVEVKQAVWQAGQAPKEAFKQIQQKFIRTENRLRKLEGFVTSNEFQINRELNKL
ncbi:envelope stress response membrane protein PspC [Agaribacter marinus]|uniref:Phage-shock protein n=1 Tax=Agaribacter marinus TaxID=1431249 RepID=A0AA37T2T1_9ALTE|nr:envelope stress response membrane protein PspC [Agaribacter marinus]GLR70660.1 phage-shock protein [Agaribacter marinus]